MSRCPFLFRAIVKRHAITGSRLVGASIPYGYILKPFKDDDLRNVIDIAHEVMTKKE
jgi:hypothetical protein